MDTGFSTAQVGQAVSIRHSSKVLNEIFLLDSAGSSTVDNEDPVTLVLNRDSQFDMIKASQLIFS